MTALDYWKQAHKSRSFMENNKRSLSGLGAISHDKEMQDFIDQMDRVIRSCEALFSPEEMQEAIMYKLSKGDAQ